MAPRVPELYARAWSAAGAGASQPARGSTMDGPDRSALIQTLRGLPGRLGALTAGLDERSLAQKPSAEAFSIRENVHHLRDIEVEGFSQRLRRLLSEEQPHLEGIDGDRLAVERRYNER